MEYDYLKLILTDDTVEITVYNRGIALFMSDDELYTGSCANSMDRGETDGRLNGKRGEGNMSCCVVAVQPRIRLTRSFDERSHSYLG